MKMKVILVESFIFFIALVSSMAHAMNTNSEFKPNGVVPIYNGVARASFYHDTSKPFRVLDTYTDGTFVVAIKMDSSSNEYNYWLRLTPEKPVDYVTFSTHGNHGLNQCVFTFRQISPTEASIEVSDMSEKGCGVDHNGSIAFNFNR